MDKFSKIVFHCFLITCCLFASSSHAQNCSDYAFSDANKHSYTTCLNLPVLNSFLHWNYHQSNHTVDIAYRQTRANGPSDWIAWALNPSTSGRRMIGAQSLVAFVSSATGSIHAYTSSVSSYDTTLQQGPLSFSVPLIAAELTNDGQMIIYATVELPPGRTSFTHVWQNGVVSGNTPQQHRTSADNMRSLILPPGPPQTLAPQTVPVDRDSLIETYVHGVLNVVSWGLLMPLGAIAARYLKVFSSANPAWFYIHVTCQSSAYIIGVAGWATGIKLGSDSVGVEQTTHRNIGITLFVLGTLQVFALLLRPKPEHKYRFYWNIYHHVTGYCVLTLSIVNIFEGFEILDPAKKWKTTYIGVLIFLGVNFAVLEAFTWLVVIKRKRAASAFRDDKYPYDHNTTVNVNGHGVSNGYGGA